ncbi:MAG: septal ring lytic transglycosylase RlpA family protein [Gammaproteobacteria bacterium]
MLLIKPVAVVALTLFVSACGITLERGDGPPQDTVDVFSIPDAVPKEEPRSRYGNPESYVVMGKRYYVMRESNGFIKKGIASWYGKKFHGRRTSSGETYNMYAMTAAHKTLPLPTYVQVTNLKNGRRVIVKVNDRGPFHENRIIDLSYTAAAKLDIIKNGTGVVEIRALNAGHYAEEGAPVRTVSVGVEQKGFYIQVGSFGELVNAEKLRKKLGILGEHLVKISQAIVGGGTVYRVKIGPLTSIDTADSIVARLGQFGVMEHHIVVD